MSGIEELRMPQDWTSLFSELGAHPADWAGGNDEANRAQLHRFLFLRQAWRQVVSDGDQDWIAREVEQARKNPARPYSGTGLALARLIASGADEADISEVVRGMQASLLFALTYLLSDPQLDDPALERAGLAGLGWMLVETDAEGEPTPRELGCLHESVLNAEPTGREMRPR
jgi:hypothetical protein